MKTRLIRKKRGELASQIKSPDGLREIKEICKSEKVSLANAYRYMDGGDMAGGKENTWDHEDFIDDILAKDNLRVFSSPERSASKLRDFTQIYQKDLFMEKVSGVYNGVIERAAEMPQKRSYLWQNADDTIANPRMDMAPGMLVLEPEMPLTAITTRITYIDEASVGIPEIRTEENKIAARMRPNPEGEDTGLFTFTLGERTATTERSGVGMQWSGDFEDSPLSAAAIMWTAEEIAVNHVDDLCALGLQLLVSSVSTDSSDTAGSWTYRKALDIENLYSNGKRLNSIVGLKTHVLDYKAARDTGFNNNTRPMDDVGLGNTDSMFNGLWYSTKTSGTNALAANKLYLYNVAMTLGLVLRTREIVITDDYRAQSDMLVRYFRRRGGWYLQHDAPIARVDLAA